MVIEEIVTESNIEELTAMLRTPGSDIFRVYKYSNIDNLHARLCWDLVNDEDRSRMTLAIRDVVIRISNGELFKARLL